MRHEIAPHFPAIGAYPSTRALEESALWSQIGSDVERLLATVIREEHAPRPAPAGRATIRSAAWNIERGIRLDGVIQALASHPQLRDSDLLLLTELDHGMARSGNRSVASEIGRALGLDLAFAPCYLSLAKGSGLESRAEGENRESIHGNAIFSRHPIREAHSLALPNGKDLLAGNEKRVGSQRAVVALVEHPLGPMRAACVHLDAHSSRRHRALQLRLLLEHLDGLEPRLPTLVGGDWNTCTYNTQHALPSIAGFWRRVLMGPRNVVENHYPYPERRLERRIFAEIEARGWRYRDLNEEGVCTFHYDVRDEALRANLGEWVPAWCFPFIEWSLAGSGGRCSLKLDWFCARGLRPAGVPRVVGDVHTREAPLSDHDPIVAELVPGD